MLNRWWDGPLKRFHSTVAIPHNIDLTNKALLQPTIAEPKVNKRFLNKISESLPKDVLESKASSLFQYSQQFFPVSDESGEFLLRNDSAPQIRLMSISELSAEEENGIRSQNNFDADLNRDRANSYINISDRSPRKKMTWLKNYVNEIRNKSKTLVFDSKTAQTELSVFSEVNSHKAILSSKMLESSHSVFEDQDKLAYFPKKLKKIYNNVLIPDENLYEIEDNTWKTNEVNVNHRKETVIGFEAKDVLIPQEKLLFKHYCSIVGHITDNLFNDEEMRKEMEKDLEVDYF